MENLIGFGMIGVVFIVFWCFAYPKELYESITFKYRSDWKISVVIVIYILSILFCLLAALLV